MLNETWNYELMDMLDQARQGNTAELDDFIGKFSPYAAVNTDYSALLVLRTFEVSYWEGERSVLNGPPKNEDCQWGITIATCDDDGGMETNIYLPNALHYEGIRVDGNVVEIRMSGNKITRTNITELYRKLDFWGDFTEEDIEKGFHSLCNEDYADENTETTFDGPASIRLPSVGEMTYNEASEQYEGTLRINDHEVEISLAPAPADKMDALIVSADRQIKDRFYEKALLDMEQDMLSLKNDAWLEEDEETGEAEAPVTPEEFRKRISLQGIDFGDDGTSTLYVDDGDLFWGHIIVVSTDDQGKYEEATLAG